MRRTFGWEAIAALSCGLLCFVPVIRWPAGLLLVGFLPGAAIARRLLGETDPLRLLILGSVLSLASLPAVAIPLALLAGRTGAGQAILCAAAITLAASAAPPRRPGGAPPAPLPWRAFALLAAVALLLQVWTTLLIFPSPGEIRWRGLPDLIFFEGIYTQIAQQVPPLDPENGRELLVHNWIYHFDFVLLGQVMGLEPLAAQRVASAWLALTLLGLVYLLGAEVLKQRAGAVLACLFVMTSGEIYWLARSLRRGEIALASMGWAHSPMGVTMIIGWYNLAPLAAALAAWYAFERSRSTGDRRWLGVSAGLCVALAFFHPVFYAVFMTSFCLWLGRVWMAEGIRAAWAAYLLTPLPFFLLYKLPYYGWSMPPQVVHLDATPGGVLARGQDLLLWCGVLIAPAIYACVTSPHGLLAFLAVVSVALKLAVKVPNPHWFGDLLHLALALAAGSGLARLVERARPAGWIAAGVTLLLAATGLGLGLGTAIGTGHVYGPDERAAAAWLEEATSPADLILIRPNSRSSYAVIGLAGRRVVHGWTNHLLDFKADAREQEAAVEAIYGSADPGEAAAAFRRLGAALVWVGPDERELVKEGRFPDRCFRLAHSSGEISIFEPAC